MRWNLWLLTHILNSFALYLVIQNKLRHTATLNKRLIVRKTQIVSFFNFTLHYNHTTLTWSVWEYFIRVKDRSLIDIALHVLNWRLLGIQLRILLLKEVVTLYLNSWRQLINLELLHWCSACAYFLYPTLALLLVLLVVRIL